MTDYLNMKEVHFSYEKWGERNEILKGFSGSFSLGELNLITGPNGSGKSTLAKIIGGIFQPSMGTVRLAGEILSDSQVLRKASFFVSQDLKSSLATNLTVKENLKLCGRLGKRHHEMLESVGLDILSNQAVYNLSGGQRQLLAIIIAAVLDKPIIIFDEPTSSLDPERSSKCVELISGLKSQDKLLLVITHRKSLWEGLYNQNLCL